MLQTFAGNEKLSNRLLRQKAKSSHFHTILEKVFHFKLRTFGIFIGIKQTTHTAKQERLNKQDWTTRLASENTA